MFDKSLSYSINWMTYLLSNGNRSLVLQSLNLSYSAGNYTRRQGRKTTL